MYSNKVFSMVLTIDYLVGNLLSDSLFVYLLLMDVLMVDTFPSTSLLVYLSLSLVLMLVIEVLNDDVVTYPVNVLFVSNESALVVSASMLLFFIDWLQEVIDFCLRVSVVEGCVDG